LPELCLDNDDISSRKRVINEGSEPMPCLLNQDRRNNLTTLMSENHFASCHRLAQHDGLNLLRSTLYRKTPSYNALTRGEKGYGLARAEIKLPVFLTALLISYL
jgi:hypothetical protein